MELGVISDIYGHWPALEAVLSDMPAVDRLVCLRDFVGYYPWPQAAIEIAGLTAALANRLSEG